MQQTDIQSRIIYLNYFTFTGKERDEETGYNYHGARYYDAGLLTGWLSVDPMADKYPGVSPYAYCMWNPVKLVDPDGEEFVDSEHGWKYNVSTGLLTLENNDGGNNTQTVKFVSDGINGEVLKKTVSFDGQIQDMFDCSVISPQADKMIDASTQLISGVGTISSGVAVGVGSSGFAAPIGFGLMSAGIYQFSKGMDMFKEGCPNKFELQSSIMGMCKTALSNIGSDIGVNVIEGLLTRGAQKSLSFLSVIRGYGPLSIDAAWNAARAINCKYPELKNPSPKGAIVTCP